MSLTKWKRALAFAALSTLGLAGCWYPRFHMEKVHCSSCTSCGMSPCSCLNRKSLAIPDTFPLGSINRAHYHTMQTNGEAGDFILHHHEFIGNTAELSPYGRDHIYEIAARMRSAPFPVIIERTENNSDPELDAHRRQLVARILSDLGNQDAEQRTVVSQAYEKGLNSRQAEGIYYNYLSLRGGNRNGFGGGGYGGGFGGGVGGGFF